jgi:pimeloyl-ACP methyl ester carboxylesterase
MELTKASAQAIQVHPDLPLTVRRAGTGKPVLVLHAGHGPDNATPLVEYFSKNSSVLAPTHPGWDGTPRPEWFSGMDDLAITYLDLLEDEDLTDVLVVACSFGGWLATEMALRDRGRRISRMILVDPAGPTVAGHTVHVPEPTDPNYPNKYLVDLLYTYMGPTMSDPKMLRRLPRVKIPVLMLWGENDDVISPEVGRIHAEAFADCRFELLPDAGHMPVRDTPEAVFARIDAFLGS